MASNGARSKLTLSLLALALAFELPLLLETGGVCAFAQGGDAVDALPSIVAVSSASEPLAPTTAAGADDSGAGIVAAGRAGAETASAGAKAASPAANSESNSQSENAKLEAGDKLLKATISSKLLKGTVNQEGKRSPLLYGSVQSIPKGTNVDIAMCGNINSEVSQKGDEVMVRVSHDVGGTGGVGVPGGWFMHGLVTDAASQKRGGRDGFVEIEFDKLVSPDGQYELPFHASVSTKDKMLKTVTKMVAIDSGYMAYGALGGALVSLQVTGIPGAIASQGYSLAIGAAAGATLGAIGAVKRKGHIASFYPGDEMKLVTAEPITLPGFDKAMLPSGQPQAKLKDMAITINKASFARDPNGDKTASLLVVDLTMANKTPKEYGLLDLAVVSDHNQKYLPSLFNGLQLLQRKVKPNSAEEAVVSFEVDGKKRKYWLVLMDHAKENELTRVPIN